MLSNPAQTTGGASLLASLTNQAAASQTTAVPTTQTQVPFPSSNVQSGISVAATPNPFASIMGGQPGQPSFAPPLQSQPGTQSIIPQATPSTSKSALTNLFGIK